MRYLLAATCLTPVALAVAAPAAAQVVISTARTTSISTSTANNGAPADIRVASGGSVRPTTSGGAVIVDSNNAVTNEATIGTNNVNDSTGILVRPGVTTTINNASAGTISLLEDYTPTDTDNDGDIDGAFAQGSNRVGIHVIADATGQAVTGNITNAGTITIEGNNSAGILLDSTLNGRLINNGTITVEGNNSAGIRANDLNGNTRIAGTITVRGANAVGAQLLGDVTGTLEIQGAITSTGYRNTTRPTTTAAVNALDADDLLQGGPAVDIQGNVTGGIIFAVPPTDASTTNNDEDNDGITDSTEGSATIRSYGAAPAIRIGSTTEDITVGAVTGHSSGHGVIVNGVVRADGVYNGITATAIQVGGLGGDVNVTGGMTIGAAVEATSFDRSATALSIGAGATADAINVTGGLVATGGGAEAGTRGEGLAIEAGATVNRVTNSGTIRGGLTGTAGIASGIVDRSGTLDLVENTGTIEASGAAFEADRTNAIDVRANNAGVTVRQNAVTSGNAPRIIGNVRFGGGDDAFEIADGTVTGNTTFGAGANRLALSGDAVYTGNSTFGAGADTIALAGTSSYNGNIDFGGGADTLTLGGTSSFTGRLVNAGGVAVTVNGGRLGATNTGEVDLGSLTMGANSTLAVTLDPATRTNTLYDVAGAASFGANSRISVTLSSIANSEGTFTVLRAGSLTGGANIGADTASLPYLYVGSVTADEAADTVALNIRRKTATELQFNASEAAAYDAIFEALDSDEQVADVFLGIDDQEAFDAAYRQLLPEHAGGTFETVTQASRATARMLQDRRIPISPDGRLGVWVSQVVWGTSKDIGNTSEYDVSGWGAAAGAEKEFSEGNVLGASFAYLLGKDAFGGNDNQVDTNQFELAGYWRGDFGPLQAYARASGAFIKFEGFRRFIGTAGDQTVTRTAEADWNGTLFSGTAGASYEIQSGRLSFRPTAAVDYYRLSEGDYEETGGGDAFDLSVDKRTGDEVAVTGSMVVGYDFGSMDPQGTWLRLEAEGGRREIVAGELGLTTARFADGDDFVLAAEDRKSGWIGRLRLSGGTEIFRLGGEFSAEEQQGHAAVAFRIGLNAAF